MAVKVFSFSDAHLGHRDCLIGTDDLVSASQRNRSNVTSSQRANVDETLEDIIAECDVIVLNGDIIDRMSHIDTAQQERVIGYVLDRIEQWAHTYPDKSFYYILGNHEGYDPTVDMYIQEHIQYDLNLPNLHFSDVGVMVGDVFFTHGDMGSLGIHPSGRHTPNQSSHIMAENENITLYERLTQHVQESESDHLPKLLVHDAEPITLDSDILSHMHIVMGHTHQPTDVQTAYGKRIMNGGHLKSGSAWDRHTNATPADLHQSIITIEDGVMVDKQRAFPEIHSWEDLVTQRRAQSQRSMNR